MPFEPFFSLYLHIPFCKQKCSYCDFTSTSIETNNTKIDRYLDALCIAIETNALKNRLLKLHTVYIGGGTPSFIGLQRLQRLLDTLHAHIDFNEIEECSIEANPESFTEELAQSLSERGVSRLSLGVQSFDDKVLRFLGRVHNADKAYEALDIARKYFKTVSVDLMCAVPGQSLESLSESIDIATSLAIDHISIYPLSIEDDTALKYAYDQKAFRLPDEDEQAEALLRAQDLLEIAGFTRYEVASYAKEGKTCMHNITYWTGKPYLGLGKSAVSMAQNAYRRFRLKDGKIVDSLKHSQAVIEDLMLGMRMSWGISTKLVEAASEHVAHASSVFEELETLGLITEKNDRFMPTQRGWLCGNEIYERIWSLAT